MLCERMFVDRVISVDVSAALELLASVRRRLDVVELDLVQRIVGSHEVPELVVSEALDVPHRQATKVIERAQLLALDTPATRLVADKFRAGELHRGHIETFAGVVGGLEHELRSDFLNDTSVIAVAASLTQRRFAERLRLVAEHLRRQRGMDNLERQKRQARLRTWTDRTTGLWHLSGVFDPETAVGFSARLEAMVHQLMNEGVAPTSPSDPIERRDHIRALALAHLVAGHRPTGAGAAELLVVVDTTQRNEFGEPVVDWGLPVDLPLGALVRFFDRKPGIAVVDIARNGKLVDRTERLELGRSTRLANRSQRRMLRGLHPTCVVPECVMPFHRCEIHHIRWWRNGGHTDLDNLAPVCSHHHHQIHEAGWQLSIDEDRRVRVLLPDGRIMTTGPPLATEVEAA